MDLHRLGEERSLEMHREIARRLRREPTLVEHARANIARWRAGGSLSGYYAEAWEALLARPIDEIVAVLEDPGEHARALRQIGPFAGVLDPHTRWRIRREVAARFGR